MRTEEEDNFRRRHSAPDLWPLGEDVGVVVFCIVVICAFVIALKAIL